MKRELTRIATTLVTLAALALSALGQKETAPAGGPPKPFVFPAVETYQLPNGLRVSLVPYGAVPKVQIVAKMRAGSSNDAPGKRWVSGVVASLLKEGTTTRSADDIARQTAEMGGNIFSGAQIDRTTVGGEVLADFDVAFVKLLADVIRNPKFANDDFETVRANRLRDLTISLAQAGTIASDAFRKAMFPGSSYGEIMATPETIKGYTLADVKSYYDANYGAARTHLYVVGQFDKAKVKAAVAAAFGDWKRGAEPVANTGVASSKRSVTVIDRPGAPQSTISIGVPGPTQSDPDFVKFSVMDGLLGGTFASRITSNIREDKGYTYSPYSTMLKFASTGAWFESADVTTSATGASIKEILFEIDRLKKEPPSDAELQGIKNNMIGLFVLVNSARGGIITALDDMNYHRQTKASLDSYVKDINAVTAADVQAMAKKYLDESKMTIVVVGDRKLIDEQIKPFGQ